MMIRKHSMITVLTIAMAISFACLYTSAADPTPRPGATVDTKKIFGPSNIDVKVAMPDKPASPPGRAVSTDTVHVTTDTVHISSGGATTAPQAPATAPAPAPQKPEKKPIKKPEPTGGE